MTITESILAAHAGKDRVAPGETVWVNADLLLTHDVCGPGTIAVFKSEFGQNARVWDPGRVVVIPDHFIFTADADARRNLETLRAFAVEQGLQHFFDAGTDRYRGVCHVGLAEMGFAAPGGVLFGTDSHTCTAGAFGAFATGIGNTDAAFVMGAGKLWVRVPETIRVVFDGEPPAAVCAKDLALSLIGSIGVDGASYCALEFAGPSVAAMDMEERMTLCNMAVEAGAKNGIIPPDSTTLAFLKSRKAVVSCPGTIGDAGAPASREIRLDVSDMVPQVARPHSPDNVAPVTAIEGTRVDRCYIGSCTGGKTADFVRAARVLDGRAVAVDTYCVPATVSVNTDLDRVRVNGRTLRAILESAGARIGPPSCAACLGGPPDTFGRLDGPLTCVSTTNRNFPGRMGDPGSAVYLASPFTVAASAVAGAIADPRRYLT